MPSGDHMQAQELEHCRIYASPEVLAAADAAYTACWRWGHLTRQVRQRREAFYDRQEAFKDAELVLYDAIRRDLGLTSVIEDGRPIPGSGWVALEVEEPPAREPPAAP